MLKFLLSGIAICVLSSCAVVMAARKEGVGIEKLQVCHTRGQFLSSGASVVTSERLSGGGFAEVYLFKKEKGSSARAFMHALLDVSTFGLWEIVGTPIEACLNDNGCFSIKVFYDCSENIQKIELLSASALKREHAFGFQDNSEDSLNSAENIQIMLQESP